MTADDARTLTHKATEAYLTPIRHQLTHEINSAVAEATSRRVYQTKVDIIHYRAAEASVLAAFVADGFTVSVERINASSRSRYARRILTISWSKGNDHEPI